MESDVTRPIASAKILYRCSCGAQLFLNPSQGGQCLKCSKDISPKVLNNDLAATATLYQFTPPLDQLEGSSFELRHPDLSTESNAANVTPANAFASNPSDLDPSVLIGHTYGHFEIISTLGRGGMGQVYRALDTSLQRYVAVKVLRSGIAERTGSGKSSPSSHEEVDKLLQEAVSQARVSHPNIVTIYYVGKQGDDPFLAMELVNGTPLSTRIAEGNLPFSEIVNIGIQLAEALNFSFELDVIHGDIKPSNILLQYNGVAKLSDFGMARRVSSNQQHATGGTPNYIAPELLQGAKPSVESDIYSLGVTLYEMSFGQLPVSLKGQSVGEWLDYHEQNTVEFPLHWPDRLPEAWKNLLGKMLAKNPTDRFSKYSNLLHELHEISPGSQVPARIFPRVVAASLDWVLVMSLAIVLEIITSFGKPTDITVNTLRAVVFLPLIFHLLAAYFWRQSVGRSLMHIRVVNRYGLVPTSWRMFWRSVMRMQFAWFYVSLSLFDNALDTWIGSIVLAMVFVADLVLVIDFAFMLFSNKRRALHDILFGTRVVLDTHE